MAAPPPAEARPPSRLRWARIQPAAAARAGLARRDAGGPQRLDHQGGGVHRVPPARERSKLQPPAPAAGQRGPHRGARDGTPRRAQPQDGEGLVVGGRPVAARGVARADAREVVDAPEAGRVGAGGDGGQDDLAGAARGAGVARRDARERAKARPQRRRRAARRRAWRRWRRPAGPGRTGHLASQPGRRPIGPSRVPGGGGRGRAAASAGQATTASAARLIGRRGTGRR